MALYLGDKKISKLYIGDTECKKAYLGDTLLLDNSAPSGPSPILNENSWQTISEVTARGEAQNYWKVGDTKTIVLNGTVGTTVFNNLSIDSVILGFDHNQELESPNEHRIHFGIGKIGLETVSLTDSRYNATSTDGVKYFNWSHWGNKNFGGWKGCDLRYDILGSTNVPPAGYGRIPSSSRVGYDPENYDVVNNPVSNTLMASLPVHLREFIKPVIKYSDNVGNKNTSSSSITNSSDYIFLLSLYEISGSSSGTNQYEKYKQKQYDYFSESVKSLHRYDDVSQYLYVSTRSVSTVLSYGLCTVQSSSEKYSVNSYSNVSTSYGLIIGFSV